MMSPKTNIGVSKEYTAHFRMRCKEDRGEEGLEADILLIFKVLWKRCGWKGWKQGRKIAAVRHFQRDKRDG